MANYRGDIAAGAVLHFSFNTRDASGNPITLAGSPVVSIYKQGSTLVCNVVPTLTVNYNSQTGLHRVIIDTSVTTSPTGFYAAGNDYFAVITTGTVNGASVVGVEVASFSIGNRTAAPTTAAIVTAFMTDLLSGTDFNTAGSFGKLIKDNVNATIASRNATTPPTVTEIAAGILFDGSTNLIKVNSDHSVNSSGGGGGGSGGTCTGFTSGALSQLAGLSIVVQLPADISPSQGVIELTAGDDYLASINRSFNITFTGTLPDMTGGSAYIAFTSAKRVVRVIQMAIVSSTSTTLVINVELTAAQTIALELGAGTWEPQFTTAGGLKWSIPSTPENTWVLLVDARPS